nr:MAG TPA: ATP synthase subunit K [Caudoviricetes sp.]
MRKLKRSIARHNMEKAGLRHYNKHVIFGRKVPSYFSVYWRAWVHPHDKKNKA